MRIGRSITRLTTRRAIRRAEQKKRLIDFTKLVTQADDAAFAARLGEYVDLEEFARFMAVMVYLSDVDGILGHGQNFYLYLDPKTQKFSFLPWDQDHSFGQFPYIGSQQQRNNLSIQKPWVGRVRFLERIFAVEGFKKLYLARLEEFSRTIFNPQRFANQVDAIAPVIRPAVQEEAKLDRFDRAVAGTSRSIVPIRPFVKLRSKSIADQLAGRSQGERVNDTTIGNGTWIGRRPVLRESCVGVRTLRKRWNLTIGGLGLLVIGGAGFGGLMWQGACWKAKVW